MKLSLVKLFRIVWRSECIPKDWARGIIVPIYKSGEKDNFDNYRGITLLSIVGKLYTTILNNRLSEWLEVNNKLVEEQGGFRKSRSASEQIFILKEVIQHRRKKKKENFLLFFRYQKSLRYSF